MDNVLSGNQEKDLLEHVINEAERFISGKREQIKLALVALLAGGHLLLNDVPGVAKTRLARVLAGLIGMSFARIQGTPDLLPSDVTGGLIYEPQSGQLSFRPGPIFHHVILFDEINRATPRTQAALLEAMEEGQVTDNGQSYAVPSPFIVLATQNPIEMEGTFSLPEAQMDRFLLSFGLGYPDRQDERDLVRRFSHTDEVKEIVSVWNPEQVTRMMKRVADVRLDDTVLAYLVDVVRATRQHPMIRLGASPRAAVQYARAVRAQAYVAGRDYVTPDDVQALAVPLLAHRIVIGVEASVSGSTSIEVVKSLLHTVPVPVEDAR